jgi:hypothetical protein
MSPKYRTHMFLQDNTTDNEHIDWGLIQIESRWEGP